MHTSATWTPTSEVCLQARAQGKTPAGHGFAWGHEAVTHQDTRAFQPLVAREVSISADQINALLLALGPAVCGRSGLRLFTGCIIMLAASSLIFFCEPNSNVDSLPRRLRSCMHGHARTMLHGTS